MSWESGHPQIVHIVHTVFQMSSLDFQIYILLYDVSVGKKSGSFCCCFVLFLHFSVFVVS